MCLLHLSPEAVSVCVCERERESACVYRGRRETELADERNSWGHIVICMYIISHKSRPGQFG